MAERTATATRNAPPTVPGTPVPEAAPKTYKDRLSKLLECASEEAPEQAEVRPTITLSEGDMETFRSWADAKYVSNIYGEVTKSGNEELSEVCLKAWIDTLWQHKIRPTNPELKDVDKKTGATIVETVFVVKEDCKFVLPKSKEDIKVVLIKELAKRFESTGMLEGEARKDAEAIVAECVNLDFVLGVIDLNDNPDEKEAYTKAKMRLMDLLEWDGKTPTPIPLTVEDRKLLFTKKPVPSVRENFFTRLVGLVKSKDQLLKVFEVIQPATAISAPKYSESARDKTRLERLIQDARKAIEKKAGE